MIDLHLHLDGSVSQTYIKHQACLQNMPLSASENHSLHELMCTQKNCENLCEYLRMFELPLRYMQTPQAVSDAVVDVISQLKNNGLIYAEIRFAPQLHTKHATQREIIREAILGLDNACKKLDFKAGLILCAMRGNDTKQANFETFRIAKEYLNSGIVAVDLAGDEALYDTADYVDLFKYATELELPYTIHAGEASDFCSVDAALNMGAKRIGHGIYSYKSAATMQLLAQKRVPLELCISSNINTCAIDCFENYPLRSLMEAGVIVTINTDNMTVSDTNIVKEYRIAREQLKLSNSELAKLLHNALIAAFINDVERGELLYKLELNMPSFLALV